jgi:hypothetical protein
MSDVTLETALKERAQHSENAESLLQQYTQTKDYLIDEFYPWVQANCPYYTDHGEQHVKAVISQASRLLENQLRNLESGDLNELDVYILCTGILWHDVGMVANREDHEKLSTEISERVKELAFPTTGIKRAVDDVIKGHRKDNGLDIPSSYEMYELNNEHYKIYPKALAAVLRFADEISETQGRVSSSEFIRGSVPEESKIFWRYAETIQACSPDLNGKQIYLNIEVPLHRAIETYPCPDPFVDRADDGEISLIEYIICRLEKMVNELAYCERYFNRYVEVREVKASLSVLDKSNGAVSEMEETLGAAGLRNSGAYPNITIYEDFFSAHSECKPETLQTKGMEQD